jgi:hypothetical protein
LSAVLDLLGGVVGLGILLLALAVIVARAVLRELEPAGRAAGWCRALGGLTAVLLLSGAAVTVARLARYRW